MSNNGLIANDIDSGLKKGVFLLFLGAGVSSLSGFLVSSDLATKLWKIFLANGQNFPDQINPDLSSVVQAIEEKGIKRENILQAIKLQFEESSLQFALQQRNELARQYDPYAMLHILFNKWRDFGTKTIVVTTNFDSRIIQEFKDELILFEDSNLSDKERLQNSKIIIIPIHGSIDLSTKHPTKNSVVLTERDAEGVPKRNPGLWSYLEGMMASLRVLTLGYSFRDPEIIGLYRMLRAASQSPQGQEDIFIVKNENEREALENRIKEFSSKIFSIDLRVLLVDLLGAAGVHLLHPSDLEVHKKIASSLSENKSFLVLGPTRVGLTTSYLVHSKAIAESQAASFCCEGKRFSNDDESALMSITESIRKTNKYAIVFSPLYHMDYFDRQHNGVLEDLRKSGKLAVIQHSISRDEALKLFRRYAKDSGLPQEAYQVTLPSLESGHQKYLALRNKFDRFIPPALKRQVDDFEHRIMNATTLEEMALKYCERDFQSEFGEMKTYVIGLIVEVVDRMRVAYSSENERSRYVAKEASDLMNGRKGMLAFLLGSSLAETMANLKGKEVAQEIAGLITPIEPYATIPLFLALLFVDLHSLSKKAHGEIKLEETSKVLDYWDSLLPSDKRLVCSELDRKSRKKPGESFEQLSVFFDDHNERIRIITTIENIKIELSEHRERLEAIEKKGVDFQRSMDAFGKRLRNVEESRTKGCTVSLGYIVAKSHQPADLLRAIQAAIDLELDDNGNKFEFVAPADVDDARGEKNLFIRGVSGSGKTRLLYELLRDEISTTVTGKVYIINPQGGQLDGKSNEKPVSTLYDQITDEDIVIWDDFPDSSDYDDIKQLETCLRRLANSSARRFLVSLNPDYLGQSEDLASHIINLSIFEITWKQQQIQDLLRSIGDEQRFKQDYNISVKPVESDVAEILYEKEPTPLMVQIFYQALNTDSMRHKSADDIAFFLDPPSKYYKKQFTKLKTSTTLKARNSTYRRQIAFLYTLKLSYELYLGRTSDELIDLQRKVFKSNCPDSPTTELRFWVRLSGSPPVFAMHDSRLDAIEFDDDAKQQIGDYLIKTHMVIGREISEFVGRLARFIGIGAVFQLLEYPSFTESSTVYSHVGFGIGHDCAGFNPDVWKSILDYANNYSFFAEGLGNGVGEIYFKLAENAQKSMLDYSMGNLDFAEGMGNGIGERFEQLEENIQKFIMDFASRNSEFAEGMSHRIGEIFSQLGEGIQKLVLDLAEHNSDFSEGFGSGIADDFSQLREDMQKLMVDLAERNPDFAKGFGSGITDDFSQLSEGIQKSILDLAGHNSDLSEDLGRTVANNFFKLTEGIQKLVLDLAEHNSEVGSGIANNFSQLSEGIQKSILDLAERNPDIASAVGYGIADDFSQLSEGIQKSILDLAGHNSDLSEDLGYGIGINFSKLTEGIQKLVLDLAEHNSDFSEDLGRRIALNFSLLSQGIQKSILDLAERNPDFSEGLGYGIGINFSKLTEGIQKLVLDLAEHNSDFSEGFGSGIADDFSQLSPGIQKSMLDLTERNPGIAKGFGSGIAHNFSQLSQGIQKSMLDLTERNPGIAKGFGSGIAHNFSQLSQGIQKSILDLAERNPDFSEELGYGIGKGFDQLEGRIQKIVLDYANRDSDFAKTLGFGVHSIFYNFNRGMKNLISEFADHNSAFQKGWDSYI